MIQTLNVTVLVNNCVQTRGLLAEHGWSLLIEADEHVFLWDAGQGLTIEHNAAALGIDLSRIEAVLISHGHYDHAGGLQAVLKHAPPAAVYMHPVALERKFKKLPGKERFREIGIPPAVRETLEADCGRLVLSKEPQEIISGFWMSGEVPRHHGPQLARDFYSDSACTILDSVPDDQTLIVETPRGIVLFTACPHAGIVNIMHAAARVTGNEKIYAIFGGFFTGGAPAPVLEEMIRRDVKLFAPAHCFASAADAELRLNFTGEFLEVYVGSRFSL